jgi:holin-like protein
MRVIKPKINIHQAKEEFLLLVLLFAISIAIDKFTRLSGGLSVMGLFFVLLKTGLLKADGLAVVTPFLLINISFFFIPPAVKVVEEAAALHGVVFKLITTLVISNILVMGVTGRVVQAVIKREHHS